MKKIKSLVAVILTMALLTTACDTATGKEDASVIEDTQSTISSQVVSETSDDTSGIRGRDYIGGLLKTAETEKANTFDISTSKIQENTRISVDTEMLKDIYNILESELVKDSDIEAVYDYEDSIIISRRAEPFFTLEMYLDPIEGSADAVAFVWDNSDISRSFAFPREVYEKIDERLQKNVIDASARIEGEYVELKVAEVDGIDILSLYADNMVVAGDVAALAFVGFDVANVVQMYNVNTGEVLGSHTYQNRIIHMKETDYQNWDYCIYTQDGTVTFRSLTDLEAKYEHKLKDYVYEDIEMFSGKNFDFSPENAIEAYIVNGGIMLKKADGTTVLALDNSLVSKEYISENVSAEYYPDGYDGVLEAHYNSPILLMDGKYLAATLYLPASQAGNTRMVVYNTETGEIVNFDDVFGDSGEPPYWENDYILINNYQKGSTMIDMNTMTQKNIPSPIKADERTSFFTRDTKTYFYTNNEITESGGSRIIAYRENPEKPFLTSYDAWIYPMAYNDQYMLTTVYKSVKPSYILAKHN